MVTHMDVQKYGELERQKKRERWMDSTWIDNFIVEQREREDIQMDGWRYIDQWIGRWMVGGWLHEWMDVLMDEWMNGMINGWMDG